MNWLVWKEYRQNWLIVVVAAGLLILPHAVAFGLSLYGVSIDRQVTSRWAINFAAAALYSLAISQLTMALLGGNLIAGERADRSAEFVAYLPLSRGKILRAKLTLAAIVTAMIWVPNLLILSAVFCLEAAGTPPPPTGWDYWILFVFGGIGLTGLLFFSVAWLLSSFLDSPTFSICAGLITPWLILLALAVANWLLIERGARPTPWLPLSYYITCGIVSVASLIGGTWYYLRRVEP